MSYNSGNQIIIVPSGCLANTEITLQCKSPVEAVYYQFSMANRLSSTEIIDEVQAQPADENLIVDQIIFSGQIFRARISGGTMNTKTGIRFLVTTRDKSVREFDVTLPVAPAGIVGSGNVGSYVIGNTGPVGPRGRAGTITIGEVTASETDGDAQVTNVANDDIDVKLNFVLPRGKDGADGEDGISPTLSIGTVTSLSPGEQPTAEIVHGADGKDTLNLGLVKGDKGDDGESYPNDGTVDLKVKSIDSSATIATEATPYATIKNTVNIGHLSRSFLLPNRPIEHVMHKGGAGGVTENTVYNARMSYNADPNISFEFDIQSTATDGKFIIWHNNNTDTMLDKNIEVQTSTYDDLRALRFRGLVGTPYEDMPMSSLEDWCEFLAQVNRPFYPEIKRFQTLDQVTQMVNLVKSYGLSKLATWENGSLDVLKHVRSIDPDVAVGYLDFYAEGQNLNNAIKAMQEMGNGCLLWQIDRLANKENVQKILDAGVRVCGWTASENVAYLKARNIGLTTITCDYTPVKNF